MFKKRKTGALCVVLILVYAVCLIGCTNESDLPLQGGGGTTLSVTDPLGSTTKTDPASNGPSSNTSLESSTSTTVSGQAGLSSSSVSANPTNPSSSGSVSNKTNSTSDNPGTSTTIAGKPTGNPIVPNKKLTPITREEYYGYSTLKDHSARAQAYFMIADAVEQMIENVDLTSLAINKEEFDQVWQCYVADHPHHFWLSNQVNYYISGDKVTKVLLRYDMDKNKKETAQIEFDQAVTAILGQVSGSMSEYERELYIHDAICRKTTYDTAGPNRYTAYGALVEGRAVCEGYAEAFQYLCYQAGISCLQVVGSSRDQAHKWNIVKIDGQHYFVDVTWDDKGYGNIPIMHTYFNLPTDQMDDHTLSGDNYPLPPCTSKEAGYHVKNNSVVTDYSIDQLSSLLVKGNGWAELLCEKGTTGEYYAWVKENSKTFAKALQKTSYTYGYYSAGKGIIIYFK